MPVIIKRVDAISETEASWYREIQSGNRTHCHCGVQPQSSLAIIKCQLVSINDYLEYNIQKNTSTGTSSAKRIYNATADNGTATTGFVCNGNSITWL